MREKPQYIDKSLLLSVGPNDPLTEIPPGTDTIVLTKPETKDLTNDYKTVETLWMRDIRMIRSCNTKGNKVVIRLSEPIHSLNQTSILDLMRHRQTEGDSIRFEMNSELPKTASSELKKLAFAIKSLVDGASQ